jgi:hypothetical protein
MLHDYNVCIFYNPIPPGRYGGVARKQIFSKFAQILP